MKDLTDFAHDGVVQGNLGKGGSAEQNGLEARSSEVLFEELGHGLTLEPVPDVLRPVRLACGIRRV
jgi:hypothetical protein